jgi:Flp pilus assembly pilin Flp
MLRCVKKFISDEAGAVTIEWVVLPAGVIALGIAGYSAFDQNRRTGVENVSRM